MKLFFHKKMQVVEPVLEILNKCERDDFLTFDEPSHVYAHTVREDIKFTSVTTFIHHFFPTFDPVVAIQKMKSGRKWNDRHEFWGKSSEEIQKIWKDRGVEAANLGTIMHNNIEAFLNNSELPPDYTHAMLYERYKVKDVTDVTPEWQYFLQYVQDTPDKVPFRTEWRIFDLELKLAGSIDMVYKNMEDGTLSIYDWKRSKEIKRENKYEKSEKLGLPDCNFFHYSLQLNTYKYMLEKSYGFKVRDLFLVVLHPNKETYQLVECADLQDMVKELLKT
jgi:ATP-dependent exoDNAse (exonuclease V) beta subunit